MTKQGVGRNYLVLGLLMLMAAFLVAGCETTIPESTGKMANQPSSSQIKEPGKKENDWKQSMRFVRPTPMLGIIASRDSFRMNQFPAGRR